MTEVKQNVPEYQDAFYDAHRDGAIRSAQMVAPLVLDLVNPQSVIDVGCGTGDWLSVFAKSGINDYQGVDQNWVNLDSLQIPREKFKEQDLEKPFSLPRQYDLVMSLEVGEHLAPECAASFVHTLTSLGPVVLFSAAVPGQGGVHHVNEQWPEYWARLFVAEGYQPVDVLRPVLWHREGVEWWYAQNLMLYVKTSHLARLGLTPASLDVGLQSLTRIHLGQYQKVLGKLEASSRRNQLCNWPLGKLLRALPGAIVRMVRR